LGIALFALLPEVGAVWGASDDKCLSRPESERPLCRCNLLKRGGWKDVSPDVRLLCEQTFTAKESEPLQSVACGAAGCLYRLNQVDKGGWKFQGQGMTLEIKEKNDSSGDHFVATLVDQKKRVTVFRNICPEGPCDPYEYVSGPDRMAKLTPGSGSSWIVQISK